MMNQDNRVLHRIGARELTLEEVERITGAFITFSVCTFSTPKVFNAEDTSHDGC